MILTGKVPSVSNLLITTEHLNKKNGYDVVCHSTL